jgi:pSer/pThr/pTyr-binding forkhead associated (FHA) protein
VDDTGISRKHVQIVWDGTRAQVEDLGSTNGSQLNGSPVQKAILEPDSVITIGRTRIVFRVLPQASTVDQYAERRVEDPGPRPIDGFWSQS